MANDQIVYGGGRCAAPSAPRLAAQCALSDGYPERFAQEALGHSSKAAHRDYAKRALMKIPFLEDYERRAAM